MFKQFLLSVTILVSSIPAFADPVLAKDPIEAQSLLSDKCRNGCLILSAEDVGQLEAQVSEFAKRAYSAGLNQGYAKGVEDLAEAAKKNPKICPKNT